MAGAHRIEPRIALAHLGEDRARQRHFLQHVERQQAGAQPVVDVMRVVGDIVGDRCALCFDACVAVELEIEQLAEVQDRLRDRAFGGICVAPVSGPLCLTRPSSVSQREVQPVEIGIAPLKPRYDPQRLGIVVEAAPLLHLLVERVLAGVAERRVAEIVHQRHRLGEVLVAAQRSRQGSRDLRHLDRMGEPRPVVIALIGDEDLRLVLQPAKGSRVDDAVAVALERRARRAFRLVVEAAARARRIGGIERARAVAETDVAEIGTWFVHAAPPVDLPLALHTYGSNANAR